MSKLIFPVVALLALALVITPAEKANARGVHFNTGRVHVDVGRPHAYYGGYGRTYGYRTNFAPRRYYPPIRGGHAWHDTSHWDWHPTEFRPHHGHIDVLPGHYDWHREGHVDHLHR